MTVRAVLPVLLAGAAVVALVLLLYVAQSRKANVGEGRRRALAAARGWSYVEPAITAAFSAIDASRGGLTLIWAEDQLSVSVGSFIDDERALASLIDASLALVRALATRATAGVESDR